MKNHPAKNSRGFLLHSPFSNRYFYRVYKKDGNFIDYEILCEELEIEIISDWIDLYESENKNYIDWNKKTLGK